MAALFDWDPAKDEENREKHAVAFTEAQPRDDCTLCRSWRRDSNLWGWLLAKGSEVL